MCVLSASQVLRVSLYGSIIRRQRQDGESTGYLSTHASAGESPFAIVYSVAARRYNGPQFSAHRDDASAPAVAYANETAARK
jgi:hypothetical protein